jgi:hypothetical protein
MGKWLTIASRRDVVIRSIKVAMVVGTILTMINHSDTILAFGINSQIMIKIMLTYCVPYCVSTYSSVGALMAQQEKN